MIITLIILLIICIIHDNQKGGSYKDDQIIYTSSLSRGGDPTAPEKIIITPDLIKWTRNRGVTSLYLFSDTIIIPHKEIVGIKIHKKLIGCDIEIVGNGFQSIYAHCFTCNNVKSIENSLKNIMTGNKIWSN